MGITFNRKHIYIIFFLALFIRLAYSVMFLGLNRIIYSDTAEYDSYAESIIKGEGFRNREMRSFRPPLYPFFLASVYFVFGRSYPAVKIVQCLLSALICVFTYIIALKVFDERYAFLCALISCMYFGLFEQPAHVITETLFTFLAALAVLFLVYANGKYQKPALSGVFFGLASLTRAVLVIFPPFLIFWFFLKDRLKRSWKTFSIILAFAALTVLPWSARNYLVHKSFVLITTQTGYQFALGHNPGSKGRWSGERLDLEKINSLPELEKSGFCFKEGWMWLKQQSFKDMIKLYVLKGLSFFHPFLAETSFSYDLTYGILFPFWIFGMFLAVKNKNENAVLFTLLILSQFALTLIFYGEPRFRNSLSPYIIILSVMPVKRFLESNRKVFCASLAAWAAVNLIIYFNAGAVYSIVKQLVSGIRNL